MTITTNINAVNPFIGGLHGVFAHVMQNQRCSVWLSGGQEFRRHSYLTYFGEKSGSEGLIHEGICTLCGQFTGEDDWCVFDTATKTCKCKKCMRRPAWFSDGHFNLLADRNGLVFVRDLHSLPAYASFLNSMPFYASCDRHLIPKKPTELNSVPLYGSVYCCVMVQVTICQ